MKNLIIIVFAVVAIFFFGCNNNDTKQTKEPVVKENATEVAPVVEEVITTPVVEVAVESASVIEVVIPDTTPVVAVPDTTPVVAVPDTTPVVAVPDTTAPDTVVVVINVKDTIPVAPVVWKSNVVYKVIAGADTITGKRGDSLNVTFTGKDSLKIAGQWTNPQTGKKELKLEANGKTFYLQPGYTLSPDSLHISGVLGDDESMPNGNVPLGTTLILILSCISFLFAFAKWVLKLW
ncbi:hypothetical protein KKG31_07255 [Patescibacteria group bacterium]|nr:hypothetical protein [Patescibacteria group bacterium]MBU1758875.1 hypothetical protein [Patescibacteria group bacterium]